MSFPAPTCDKTTMEASPFRFLLFSLLLILLHAPKSKSQSSVFYNCSTDANYTANSAFQSNLNLLLSTLPNATAPTGFYNTTVGRNGDEQVYGLALCRGDVSPADCNTCLTNATHWAVVEYCPRGMSNTVWYDTCMLRYSNINFFGVVDWTQIFAWNLNNVTDPKLFDDQLNQLMDSLSTEAAYGSGQPPLFAVGQIKYINSTNIYGLAQCTRDLSPADCNGCLNNCIKSIPNCCATRIGGRIFGETCNIRFESAPFYKLPPVGNTTAPPPPQSNGTSMVMPPPPAGSGGGCADSECHKVVNSMGVQTGGTMNTIIILLGLITHTAILLT